jgi:hypothetical protein
MRSLSIYLYTHAYTVYMYTCGAKFKPLLGKDEKIIPLSVHLRLFLTRDTVPIYRYIYVLHICSSRATRYLYIGTRFAIYLYLYPHTNPPTHPHKHVHTHTHTHTHTHPHPHPHPHVPGLLHAPQLVEACPEAANGTGGEGEVPIYLYIYIYIYTYTV